MSTTELEAINGAKAATDAVDVKVTALTTAVNQLIATAANNPAKIAALDAITAQLTKQQSDLQAVTDAAVAALTPAV